MQKIISESSLFKNHQNNFVDSYDQFLDELREDIREGHESEILSEEFQEEFKEIIFSEDLDSYHPLNFYWLNLIDKLVETIGLFEEEEVSSTEELIGAFSDSDLLGFIVDQLEANVDIETVIDQIFEIQEIQIISFFHLHISLDEWVPTGPVSYQLVSEIGEASGHIFLGPDKKHFYIPEFENDDFIPVCGYFPEADEIQVSVDKEVKVYKSTDFPNSQSGSLFIFPGLKGESFQTKHFDKVSWASEVIQKVSPALYTVLKKYTSAIVPLYQEEIVSFSMQVLPSYSCINMENRDRVDLIDDLLHENGHHFLNSILEGEEDVIYEDDEKIFYSPWR
ncbi:MAG: hypothetical protein NXH75_15610, partial [Halobacteriovoraceae bacterium]|nr:hypothetical protein [Halobacteriovoraceae bacterium]